MINLLPNEARRELVKEYWLRVITVWAFLGTAVLLGIAALFLPSYLLIESEKKAFEAANTVQGDAAETIAVIEAEVVASNGLARELKNRMNSNSVTAIVQVIKSAVPSGITIRLYKTARTDLGIESIQVSGVAASREALIAFQKALQEREEFTDAIVPIDDFVRGRDLPFEIRLTVADNFR